MSNLGPNMRGSALVATPEEIKAQLQEFSREPFTEVLAELLSCKPSLGALQAFANDSPDKWASAMKTVASLAGYHDKLEINQTLSMEVAGLSDSELLARAEAAMKVVVVEGEFEQKKEPTADAEDPLVSMLGPEEPDGYDDPNEEDDPE